MKHYFRYLAFFIFLVVVSSNTLVAKNVEIRLNLKKGEQYKYVVTAINKIDQKVRNKPVQMEQRMTLTINQVVLNKLNNGNYLLKADYEKFRIEIITEDNKIIYDSDSVLTSNGLERILKIMTTVHLKYEVSPSGIVSNMTGLEELSKQVASNMQMANLIRNFGTNQLISQMYSYMPKGKVEIGEKWVVPGIMPELNDLKYDINYTLIEALSENIKLDLHANFKFISAERIIQKDKDIKISETGIQKGDVVLNSKNKMPLSSFLDQEINMIVTATDTLTKSKEVMPMKLISKTSMKLVK